MFIPALTIFTLSWNWPKKMGLSKQGFCSSILDDATSPYNSGKFYRELTAKMSALEKRVKSPVFRRYYAMDRDNHWDRIEKALSGHDRRPSGKNGYRSQYKSLTKSYDAK